jgi:hypothetical protein
LLREAAASAGAASRTGAAVVVAFSFSVITVGRSQESAAPMMQPSPMIASDLWTKTSGMPPSASSRDEQHGRDQRTTR